MAHNKVVRSVCLFCRRPEADAVLALKASVESLTSLGYEVQTTRMCCPGTLLRVLPDGVGYLCLGSLSYEMAASVFDRVCDEPNISFNIDLTEEMIEPKHVEFLRRMIANAPAKTFNFAYVFNNKASSPYFPSAFYDRDGISVGLQPTDLAEDCQTLQEWLAAMLRCWSEIAQLFEGDSRFIGIDASIAPFASGKSSLLNFVKRLGFDFERSLTSTTYVTISDFLRTKNPKPTGLSGLMFPCLEDAELAAEYDEGRFTIEKNLFLALQSGLGVDTYPIAVDENPSRVFEILRLIQALSNKFAKPMSARFVSDGRARIGERTDFRSPYLTDCTVRAL